MTSLEGITVYALPWEEGGYAIAAVAKTRRRSWLDRLLGRPGVEKEDYGYFEGRLDFGEWVTVGDREPIGEPASAMLRLVVERAKRDGSIVRPPA